MKQETKDLLFKIWDFIDPEPTDKIGNLIVGTTAFLGLLIMLYRFL